MKTVADLVEALLKLPQGAPVRCGHSGTGFYFDVDEVGLFDPEEQNLKHVMGGAEGGEGLPVVIWVSG